MKMAIEKDKEPDGVEIVAQYLRPRSITAKVFVPEKVTVSDTTIVTQKIMICGKGTLLALEDIARM